MWSIRLEGEKRLRDLVDQLSLERRHGFRLAYVAGAVFSNELRRYFIATFAMNRNFCCNFAIL